MQQEQAYSVKQKPTCPKHPSKTIQYFCTQDACSDRMSCSSCLLKKQFCRHDMSSIVDISQFLFKQKKAMQMNGLSSQPDIYNFLVHKQDRKALYAQGLRDQMRRFKAQLDEVSDKVNKRWIHNSKNILVVIQVQRFDKMQQMLMKKITDAFQDSYLSRFQKFQDIIEVSQCNTLAGLKSMLQKMSFQISSQTKIKDIKKTYQSIVSMQQQTPMIDYQKYQHIKSHFKLFQNKLSQAGPTLITLKIKDQAPPQQINVNAIVQKISSLPITNIRKMAQSSKFPTGHTRTVFTISKVKDRIVTGSDDGSIRIFDSITYQQVTSQSCHSAGIRAISQLPNNLIATGSYDKTVKIWNIDQFLGQSMQKSSSQVMSKWIPIRTLSGHSSSVISLQYLNDSVSLASGSADYSIKIWNITNGSCKNFTGHMNDILCFACSYNGNILVSGSADRTIKTWSLSRKYSNTCLKTMTGHTDAVWTITLLGDQTTLFSGSLDKTIRMWNISLGSLLKTTVSAHTSHITKVLNFSQGIIGSCSQDGHIKLWDYRANIEVHNLVSKKSGFTTMVSGDGGSLLSVNQQKQIQVWD